MTKVTSGMLGAAVLLWAAGSSAIDLGATGMLGYQQGFGIRATGEASRLIEDAPLGLSFSVAYVFMDPGNAQAARSIFINDATNGTPETSGQTWTLALNAIWYLPVPGVENFGIILGPRFSAFSGRFKYVGGNEDFNVTTDEWGVGTGSSAGSRSRLTGAWPSRPDSTGTHRPRSTGTTRPTRRAARS